jgi:tripartite-type tricarboxylate transporter receptor subunit TctC
MARLVQRLALLLLPALFLAPAARSEEPVSFKDKTITMIIGYAPGGGTDASGRVIAPFLSKHLPGQPTVVVRNMPGADGMTSLNYLVQQTKPDGLTVTMGSSTQVDPINYRKAQVQYDPAKFFYIGGVGRGGSVVMINREAEKRLLDRRAPPVVMGSIGGWPRSSMQVTAWGIAFLGWNARWVVGYQGTNDVILALEQGEVDMTSTGNMFQIQKLIETGKFSILNQSGSLENGKFVGRPDFPTAPVFSDQMDGKIPDKLGAQAFKYWINVNAMDKWVGLVPGTPAPIVAAYRDAYAKTSADPEFVELGRRISEDFGPMSSGDVELLVHALADTPPEVMDYLSAMLAKQGLKVGD